MKALYDTIGEQYSIGRREDPQIAANIAQFLTNAESILNIGAGTGSYEPHGKNVFAVEPSLTMIEQRAVNAAPVKQASAESLPFPDNHFTHAMTILSMHHWSNRAAAFNEIKRVTTERFIAVTWNPNAEPYWLTAEYFPEIHEIDCAIFPSLDELSTHFTAMSVYPLPIPATCIDGFTAAYWARPHAYLDPSVRASMSTFSKINNLTKGLTQLETDLSTGLWEKNYGRLKQYETLDVGYNIVVCDL